MNEITDITETSGAAWPAPAHDASGNMTSAPCPLDLGNSFDLTWDAWNRLVEVGDGSATVATYRYDGASRRVSKDDGTHTRHYYYSDRWQVLEERLDAGTSADRQYVWGVKSIDDLILRDDADLRLYAMNDAMGSVTAVVDTSGSVQERYGYNGFGAPRYMDATFSPRTGSDYDWETLFDGYRYDTDTGLYQVRYRYLHPKLGRWLSRDPVKEKGGKNLCGFVSNNPINLADKDGRYTIVIGSAVLVTAAGAVLIYGGYQCYQSFKYQDCRAHVLSQFRQAEADAEITAGHNGSHDYEGSDADALTHCTAACMIARNPGPCKTLDYALNNIQDRENPETAGGYMDMQNNLTGSVLGQKNPQTSCHDACIEALNDELLFKFDKTLPEDWPSPRKGEEQY